MEDEMIEGNYEHETGLQIMNHFLERHLNYQEVEMELVANHPPITWGKTPEKAVYNSAVLETITQMAFIIGQLNPSSPRLKASLIKKHFDRKHGAAPYYGQ